jgi:Zn-dependent protease with chaperone function
MFLKSDKCPECYELLTYEKQVPPWCGACGWGAGAGQMDTSTDTFSERIRRRLSRSMGNKILQTAIADSKDDQTLRSIASWQSRIAIFAYVALITVTVALAAYLVFYFWINPIVDLIAAALIGLVWTLRPRLPPLRKTDLTREAAPNLFGLIDQVSENAGTQTIQYVCISPSYNAFVYQAGPKATPVLTIGLLLWSAISRQEKVALLSHELAHIASNDPARGRWYVATHNALSSWLGIFENEDSDVNSLLGRTFFLPVTVGVRGLLALLETQSFKESQLAEYRADKIGSIISGRKAMIDLLMSMKHSESVYAFLLTKSGARSTSGEAIIEEFPRYISALPEAEVLRLTRMHLSENVSVDRSHPANQLRIKFLRSLPDYQSQVLLDEYTDKEITSELSAYFEPMSYRLYHEAMGIAE